MTNVGDPITRKTRLLSRQCDTCIFRPPGERIDLDNQRISEFIRGAVERGGFVVCHATLPGCAPRGVEPAVCRGFADRYDTTPLQVMRRLWGFQEVDPPTAKDLPTKEDDMSKPNINPNCVANRYAAADERIIEVTGQGGTGCLISVRNLADGSVVVEVYRADPGITVRWSPAPPPDEVINDAASD